MAAAVSAISSPHAQLIDPYQYVQKLLQDKKIINHRFKTGTHDKGLDLAAKQDLLPFIKDYFERAITENCAYCWDNWGNGYWPSQLYPSLSFQAFFEGKPIPPLKPWDRTEDQELNLEAERLQQLQNHLNENIHPLFAKIIGGRRDHYLRQTLDQQSISQLVLQEAIDYLLNRHPLLKNSGFGQNLANQLTGKDCETLVDLLFRNPFSTRTELCSNKEGSFDEWTKITVQVADLLEERLKPSLPVAVPLQNQEEYLKDLVQRGVIPDTPEWNPEQLQAWGILDRLVDYFKLALQQKPTYVWKTLSLGENLPWFLDLYAEILSRHYLLTRQNLPKPSPILLANQWDTQVLEIHQHTTETVNLLFAQVSPVLHDFTCVSSLEYQSLVIQQGREVVNLLTKVLSQIEGFFAPDKLKKLLRGPFDAYTIRCLRDNIENVAKLESRKKMDEARTHLYPIKWNSYRACVTACVEEHLARFLKEKGIIPQDASLTNDEKEPG